MKKQLSYYEERDEGKQTLLAKREARRASSSTMSQEEAVTVEVVLDEKLSKEELKELRACEKTIRSGMKTFVEVGEALMRIRDAKLYREKHRTFEAYARAQLDLSRPHAYSLMGASEVVRDLSSMEDIPMLPTNERQARELATIDDAEKRREAWLKAVTAAKEKKSQVTAKLVHAVVTDFLPKKKARKTSAKIPSRAERIAGLLGKLEEAVADDDQAIKTLSELRKLVLG